MPTDMALETRTETITAHDGGSFNGYMVLPETGSGPGIVVLQEIFGVGSYIREATQRVAALGLVAIAPDLYWRIQPGAAFDHDEAGLEKAMALSQGLDFSSAVDDSVAAFEHLRTVPEVQGKTGVLGFCLGGSLAYMVAAESDPDAAVSYYGSAVPESLERAADITCPTLFHFGGSDPYIPREQVERVKEVADAHAHMELYIQEDAGHAFDNHMSGFHHPAAADAAWRITSEFLQRTLLT